MDPAQEFKRELVERLFAVRSDEGLWRGALSSSALATAVSAFALEFAGNGEADARRVDRAHAWLAGHANPDGGWGDTPRSPSNPSTTLLVWAALTSRAGAAGAVGRSEAAAAAWLEARLGGLDNPERVIAAVLTHYGSDRTFSVPILTLCALASRLGGVEGWRRIPQLPFELAALPRGVFRFLGLPVVSYALPALISMGLVRHCRARQSFPGLGAMRRLATPRVLKLLERMQPAHGGFLEASPLTAFVAMALAGSGLRDHPVLCRALDFLREGQREDGSWPIDTDLATWLTSMAARYMADELPDREKRALVSRLLEQQCRETHPFTGARPGGWAWTDGPGGVPDADDTAGVLIALRRLGAEPDAETMAAARQGLEWLLRLRNRDGGMPTFCRGWGRLPFDRSCADITAHAFEAFACWEPAVGADLARRLERARRGFLRFLAAGQTREGAWLPLWFGNAAVPTGENPVYGTARVLAGLQRAGAEKNPSAGAMMTRAAHFLIATQNPDGGWGGARGIASSVEETSLAVRALAPLAGEHDAASRGLGWLLRHRAQLELPAPIGLYFASLWYWERLYPPLFALGAVRACLRHGVSAA